MIVYLTLFIPTEPFVWSLGIHISSAVLFYVASHSNLVLAPEFCFQVI